MFNRSLIEIEKGLCPAITAAKITIVGKDEVEVHGVACTS
jgi:hypothetical protein